MDDVVRFTTYKLADGELVCGEYSFVTETEFFDDADDEVEVLKEVWVRESAETVTFNPSPLCPACNGEGETAVEGQPTRTCPACLGTGDRQ